MERVVENTSNYTTQAVDSKTIKTIVENIYDLVREESKGHMSEDDLNALRHSIVTNNGINYDAPLFQRIVEKGNIRMANTQLPILLINKLNREALSVIFFEMKEYFKCNSFSKLMKYLAITNSFMVNEYLKNKTTSKLCLSMASA